MSSPSEEGAVQSVKSATDADRLSLQILLTIMSGAFGLAGWHFSRNPTSSSSENPVAKAENSEPWKTGGHAKYQYHPGGDTSKAKKDAPSALNEVIIPNVNLPRVCLATFAHQYCPPAHSDRNSTKSTTSGARKAGRMSGRIIIATPSRLQTQSLSISGSSQHVYDPSFCCLKKSLNLLSVLPP